MTPLLLNIGNTHVEAGLPDQTPMIFATADFSLDKLPSRPSGQPLAAACVVPRFLPELREAGCFLVGADTASGLLDFSRVDASTLGADRIANAAALLADESRLPAVCLDAGTAVTLEIVDEQKRFLGGAILPGRGLMRKSLHAGTGQLPEISFSARIPDFPAANTENSIRLGTDGLLLDGVRALLVRARKMFPGKQVRLVSTGGDGSFFQSHIPELEEAPADFTMSGILRIYESCQKKERDTIS